METIPMLSIKLYMYQLFRSLAYLHALGIAHRDIKPQNVLVDRSSGMLKLCDFRSAKFMKRDLPHESHICFRYYRAPELIFGSTDYDVSMDVWSTGCIMAELMLGRPIFCGHNVVGQLVEICKVLGTPTRSQAIAMNPEFADYIFPKIPPAPWPKVFKDHPTTTESLDLIGQVLEFSPVLRVTAIQALVHPFFDELRQPETKMVDGKDLPPLFDFSAMELAIEPCPGPPARKTRSPCSWH
ncbi:protein kinase gsk3 [Phlyctochytrium arcticum]|nr:protein kinase gsk3 [Phlyctochytrium arcticum]